MTETLPPAPYGTNGHGSIFSCRILERV